VPSERCSIEEQSKEYCLVERCVENIKFICENTSVLMANSDSVLCVATRYGMDGPGSNPGGGQFFANV
jgi:hypothetical protein